ncbi:MAG: hypothetical protein KKB51_24910 [Candidatus Riflebacteria bacterium]|nr:hypothetical protein [Candidatus Riflebacteria bacterium]
MTSKSRSYAYIFALIIFCLLISIVAKASRPSPRETAANRCSQTMSDLEDIFTGPFSERMVEMTGMRSGVIMIDGKVLKYLMEHDTDALRRKIYDQVAAMETGFSKCRYYCIFNLDRQVMNSSFVLVDTKHGYHGYPYGIMDKKLNNFGPRSLFKELCTLFGTDEFYDRYSSDFLEETEDKKNLKTASTRDVGLPAFLARYWFVIVLLFFLDFYFIDLSYMESERVQVKDYAMGLHLVCSIMSISYVLIHYTGTPFPDVKTFLHLTKGAYPQELHFLADVTITSTFVWWPISIIAVWFAGRFNCSPVIPLLYVIAAPLALAISENPFGGIYKLAFPVCGVSIMLINAVYIKIKYKGRLF